MEIIKLDRHKAREKAYQKKPVIRDEKPSGTDLPSLKGAWKNIPRKRLTVYGALIIILLIVTLVYNIYMYLQANQPILSDIPEIQEELSIEFYNLCADIEEYKEEYGAYPDSAQDMLFSDHLKYRKYGNLAFQLRYDDGKIRFNFDSATDLENIK